MTSNKTTIHIANDFSRYPSGRALIDGPYSGTKFRDENLKPALNQFAEVEIILDDVMGYPSSFIEEAFGGLVRDGYDKDTILNQINVKHDSDAYLGYKQSIIDAIRNATNQNQ